MHWRGERRCTGEERGDSYVHTRSPARRVRPWPPTARLDESRYLTLPGEQQDHLLRPEGRNPLLPGFDPCWPTSPRGKRWIASLRVRGPSDILETRPTLTIATTIRRGA